MFFAIPFDPAIWSMYHEIVGDLKTKYRKRLQFVFGNEEVRPSERFINIQAFKAQNADLLRQFYRQINSSDIIIADLTNNNPNVHLELGIALSQNKNILRVVGRNIVEVGSDIKGYYVYQYPDGAQLFARLEKYLDMFLRIKALPLNRTAGPFYKRYPKSIGEKLSLSREIGGWGYAELATMRDGEVIVTFSLSSTNGSDPKDWFGASIRYPSKPWGGGYLIYVRRNGNLEIAQMPGIDVLQEKRYPALKPNQNHTLHFKVDGSNLVAWLDGNSKNFIQVSDLINQSFGRVALACFNSKVKVKSIKTVCRDTIDDSSQWLGQSKIKGKTM